jgi:quercetin dioxygenase-like cupin family protein
MDQPETTSSGNLTQNGFFIAQRRLVSPDRDHLSAFDGKQTGEKFTAFLNVTPPGGGPGPHYHENEDEWFYIVEGKVSFLLNGTWTDMFPGDCVYAPRGSVHAFKNTTDQTIRVFINIAPSGFEGFFAEAAEWWATPERDVSRLAAIEAKYRTFSVKQ